MPHRATKHLMGPLLEAYAILLKRLADSVYGLSTALGCIMMYTTIIAAFSILCLSATFYILVTSIIGVTPWREAGLGNMRAPTEVRGGLPDEAIAATMDMSLANIPNRSSNKIPVIRINGLIDTLPAKLPPAIPPYLKDCEFYYNTVDMNLIENTSLCLGSNLQVARLTMGEQIISNSPGYVKMVLENLERGRIKFNEQKGVFERSESERGMLELWDRVYVGPAEWLLRVLVEA